MKPVVTLLITVLFFTAMQTSVVAQCAGGKPAFALSSDTTIYGNGNDGKFLTFPRFDPSLGTLLSAEITSVVGLEYSFTLQNQTTSASTYRTQLVRTDDIYSSALDPSSISNIKKTPFVFTLIQPGELVAFASQHLNYSFTSSIADGRLLNFMGTGNAVFDYETGTSSSIQGASPFQLTYTSLLDTTRFSITYHYCAATLLSADLLFFTAVPQVKNNVLLNWRQAAVETGRTYHLQVSMDGKTFTTVAGIPENSSGNYNYNYLNKSATVLNFRIEEVNASGEVKYSNIRTVQFDAAGSKGKMVVFPSLYAGGNLHIGFPEKNDWQVILYSLDGRKIAETRQMDAYNMEWKLPGSLGNGIYIIKAFNLHTADNQLTRIIIQR